MKHNEYELSELQAGVKSSDIVWSDSSNLPEHNGNRNGLPRGFEFPALCRMASIIKHTEPSRPIMEKLYPNGFTVKMTTVNYSTLEIIG